MKNVSIIIVNYKSKGLLKNCLKSVFNDLQGGFLNYQIIVIDNFSQDGSEIMLKNDFPAVRKIFLSKNIGYAKAVNLGIESWPAKYYFILNPDILFLENKVIERIYNFMEASPQIGLVGPKLINPDGSIQYSCCEFPTFLIPIYRRTQLKYLPTIKQKLNKFLMADWDHQSNRQVDWVLGTGMFVRDKALREAGKMDERFFMYFEDVDWCRRFQQSHWPVYYLAEVQMVHYHGRPSAEMTGFKSILFHPNTQTHIISWLKYFLKYLGTEKRK